MVKEITSIWKEITKQDEEKVDNTWLKTTTSMDPAFEKDKQNLSRCNSPKALPD